MDERTELSLINKHVRQHNRDTGESLIWFEFVPMATAASAGSFYDDVYDEGAPGEGGREYTNGILIPTVYVVEVEDRFTYQEEGRQPTQNLQVTMLYLDVVRAGMTEPREYKKHLNDMFFYDGRYYKVSDYHVRGRLGPTGEVVVGVQGYEVYIDQEFVYDDGPPAPIAMDYPWPTTFPS